MSFSRAITGGRVLRPEGWDTGPLVLTRGLVAPGAHGDRWLDATSLLVLPGIVDLHGDAFERQLQPRPGANFPARMALTETDAHVLANGITTVFHGVTLSWEPGLRGTAQWRALLDALADPTLLLGADTRVHLRWEAFNVDDTDLAVADIEAGRVGMLALNDHTPSILTKMHKPLHGAKYSARAGLEWAAFQKVAEQAGARDARDVAAAEARVAAAARAACLPIASHDDATVEQRDAARALGATICEFPVTRAVAEAARAAGDHVAMGCPNVVRGGSHIGWASAAEMAEAGLCDVLVSDYFHPAMPAAAFALAARGVLDFPACWALVSSNPARAAGLSDRGTLARGMRGDVVLVAPEPHPRVVATLVAGRIAWLAPGAAERLHGGRPLAAAVRQEEARFR